MYTSSEFMLFSSQRIVYKNESTEKKEGKITIKKDSRFFFFFFLRGVVVGGGSVSISF